MRRVERGVLVSALVSMIVVASAAAQNVDLRPWLAPSSLDPARCTVQHLDQPKPGTDRWHVPLTIDHRDVVLDVVLTPVRTPTEAVMIEGSHGGLVQVVAPPPMTYRGAAIGLLGSAAAVSVVPGGVRAVIDTGDGRLWFVQPKRDTDPGAAEGEHVVYESSAVRAPGVSCGGALEVPGGLGHADAPGFGSRAACLREVQVGLDLDYLYYQHRGSSIANCIADSDSLVNGLNIIYERDINVTIVVSARIFRTSDVIYNTPDIGALLNQLQGEWNGPQGWRPRDLAHLFTGQPTGGVIGLAYVDVVCNKPWAHGVSNVDFTGDYGARVGLVAHEIGHNFAAGHCDGQPDCSIMCSGLGGCAGNLSAFSEGVVGAMRGAAGRVCLVDRDPAPDQRAPGAIANSYTITANTPTRFDVLDNDRDPNCDALSIAAFDTTTPGGATVSLSVGTGPGGRDELLYAPKTDAVGQDSFTYRAADPAGGNSTARVYVNNQTLRDPDPTGVLRPGLDAAFYRTGGFNSLPDFTPLTPSSSAVWPTINFPSSSSNVVGSGLSVKVAAVFTGQVQIATAGTYTFFASSDDGSAIFIDGTPVVLNDFVRSGMMELGGAVELTAGVHEVRVEYFLGSQSPGGLVVRYQGPGVPKQIIPAGAWVAPGVTAQYYALPNGLTQLPDFSARTPYRISVAPELNVPSGTGLFLDSGRDDEVAAVFTGFFLAPTDGDYVLFTESNEGSKLFIGTNTVVNNDGRHNMAEVGGAVRLKAGPHALRLEYFENVSSHGLILRALGPGMDKQVVPGAMLAREVDCPVDFNRDGFVSGEDFDEYVAAFESGDPSADFNGDGFVSGDDFDAFVAAFEIGC